MKTLHLCNTHGQLLMALCDVVQTSDPVTLIYLSDEIALPDNMQKRLRDSFAHLTLHVCADAVMAQQFADLPMILPAVIRRNLRLRGARPQNWQPAFLAGQHFDHAYIHNTGFFAAKVVAGMADHVTLRESGLNNYTGRPVTGLKRALRRLAGYTAHWQIMGEEPWVAHIAVARPDDLPTHVRPKGVQHDLQTQLAALDGAQKQTLLNCFSPDLPVLPADQRTALLLTQPLDLVGMCDTATKHALYGDMVRKLRDTGYRVFLKNHPRDAPFALPDTTAIDPVTPIELWSLTSPRPFDLGLALCSASLSYDTDALCQHAVQLVTPDTFYPAHFNDWHSDLPRRLDAALAP